MVVPPHTKVLVNAALPENKQLTVDPIELMQSTNSQFANQMPGVKKAPNRLNTNSKVGNIRSGGKGRVKNTSTIDKNPGELRQGECIEFDSAKLKLDGNVLQVKRNVVADKDIQSAIAKQKLEFDLAFQDQLGQKGKSIAGFGLKKPVKDAPRLARKYGGNPNDWVKKSSNQHEK